MKFQSVKSDADVRLDGITSEIEYRDGSPCSITLTDCSGNMVKVSRQDYSFTILVPAPPKMVTKYKVSGSLAGVADVYEVLDTEYEAQQRQNEIEKKFNYSDDVTLTVSPVEVVAE